METCVKILLLLSGVLVALIVTICVLATRKCPSDQVATRTMGPCDTAADWIKQNYEKHNIYKVNGFNGNTPLDELKAYIYQCEGRASSKCPNANGPGKTFTCEVPLPTVPGHPLPC